jgi:tryptophan-rich sensory protein
MLKEINWASLIACIAIPLVAGTLSGLANVNSINSWYSTLNKPSFNPPNYLFGPVWTVLYILMGISLYLVVQTTKSDLRTTALMIFSIQLLLNFSWSFAFFYFQSPILALVIIITMLAGIVLMILYFYRLSHAAAYLQIPYLLWVSFATVLNGAVWMLNK